MSLKPYTRQYYEIIRAGSLASAQMIVPLVLEYLEPKSVVDVGCGDGTWLSVFRQFGVSDFLGIDGAYVGDDLLQIPRSYFQAIDLRKSFALGKRFDLAVSLEVAEHLPKRSSDEFVESLTKLAPAILFSAAIPYQGGNHHINECWPEEWAQKFANRGYLLVDCIRKRVWDNRAVEWWYAQNAFLFAQRDLIARNEKLTNELERTNLQQLSLVHPRNFLDVVKPARPVGVGVFGAFRLLFSALRNAILRRIYILFKLIKSNT